VDCPPLLKFESIDDYRTYFKKFYCRNPILTFDNIPVFFHKNKFDHAFFERSKRSGIKDIFSWKRAERMNWIKHTLQDQKAELYIGWDKNKKRYIRYRRVSIVNGNYVVVIHFHKSFKRAFFVTAYVADSKRTLEMIKRSPKWQIKSR